MPEISRFYGIIITMFVNEHNPPHFHVRYMEHRALIDIANGTIQVLCHAVLLSLYTIGLIYIKMN